MPLPAKLPGVLEETVPTPVYLAWNLEAAVAVVVARGDLPAWGPAAPLEEAGAREETAAMEPGGQ